MITVNIGRTFLKAYNKKYEKELSAKEFFEEVFLEEFYNHPKYLMSGGNSPLENPKISWKKGERPSLENRQERINKTIEKIDSDAFDASIALGFPASDDDGFQPTSGLVTDIANHYKVEDKYYSWIGSGLSIGVAGGLSILFDQPEILLKTYEGWQVYRSFLNDPSLERLAGNKITSWNGQWLSYVYSKYIRDSFDFTSLNNLGFFKHDNSGTVIETVKWSRLFFNLSQQFPEQTFIGYVFSFGKTNKTLGFFPFRFQQAQTIIKFYKQIFGVNSALEDKDSYEKVFGMKFYEACKIGTIGIQALKPENLFEDINKDKALNLIEFRTYKTWLLAMINKEETLSLADDLSRILHLFKDGSKGTERRALVEKKLLQSGKKQFLINWEELVIALPEQKMKLKEISDKVYFMDNESFGYFLALLKLEYRYKEV